MRPAHPPRACIFCGGKPLTKEHIFADWLQKHLPKTGLLNHDQWHKVYSAPYETNEEFIKRSGEPHSGRIKCVCADCNNGWMSSLQVDAKPILLPLIGAEPIQLFRRQKAILSTWVSMFTTVAEFRDKTGMAIAIPERDRVWLRARRSVPQHWRIWIGHHIRSSWNGIWVHASVPVGSEEYVPDGAGRKRPIPNTQSTTIVLGQLFIHVFSSARKEVSRVRLFDNRALAQIWPVQCQSISWPPKLSLDDAAAKEISCSLIRHARTLPPEEI